MRYQPHEVNMVGITSSTRNFWRRRRRTSEQCHQEEEREDTSIQKAVRSLKGEGFIRFHSKKWIRTDCINIRFGMFVHMTALYCLWSSSSWRILGIVFLLCLSCAWPSVLAKYNIHFYERWRDMLLCLHFLVHHVYATHLLMSLGLDTRRSFSAHLGPVKFLFLFLATSNIPWHVVHAVTYKLSTVSAFVLTQPFLLYLLTGLEAGSCRYIVIHYPAASLELFKKIHYLIGVLVSYTTSISLGISLDNPTSVSNEMEGYAECKHVMIFLTYFLGVVLPGFRIYVTQKLEWREFVNSSSEEIYWNGGPSTEDISAALHVLRLELFRREERSQPLEEFLSWSSIFACAIIVWVYVPYIPIGPVFFRR